MHHWNQSSRSFLILWRKGQYNLREKEHLEFILISEERENIAKNRKETEGLRARANEQSTKEMLQCKDALEIDETAQEYEIKNEESK